MVFCTDVEQRPQSTAVPSAVQVPPQGSIAVSWPEGAGSSSAVMGGPTHISFMWDWDTLSFLKTAPTSRFQPSTAFGRNPGRPTSHFSLYLPFAVASGPVAMATGRRGARRGRAAPAGPGEGRGRDSARCGRVPGRGELRGDAALGGGTAGGAASGSAPGVAGRAGGGLRHRETVPAGFGACGQRGAGLGEGWPSFVH